MTSPPVQPVLLHKGCITPDGTVLAAPLQPADAAAMGVENASREDIPVPLFIAGTCTSTFDLAWELSKRHPMPAWSAVLALMQNSGRGQTRRPWHSPPGNLYVSFVLPDTIARMGTLASLAVGYLVHAALSGLGYDVVLKWPNDILFSGQHGSECKVGGILLEEKGGHVLAGLGLNTHAAPEKKAMRPGSAAPAAVLEGFGGTVCCLWLSLLRGMRDRCARDFSMTDTNALRQMIEGSLAWRDRMIRADEAGITGRLHGLAIDGSLLVRTESGTVAVNSGSIRLAE